MTKFIGDTVVPYDLGTILWSLGLKGEAGRETACLPCMETERTRPAMSHPPQEIFIDSMSSLMFNLLKSLTRLFDFNISSVPLKSFSA